MQATWAGCLKNGVAGLDLELLAELERMGFEPGHCVKALRKTGGDQDRAIEWLRTHRRRPIRSLGFLGRFAMKSRRWAVYPAI